jgi:hypothetical protein
MHNPARFRVEIIMRSASERGRLTPILTGYRPGFWLDGRMHGRVRAYTDAAIELASDEQLAPGLAARLCYDHSDPSSGSISP